MSKKMLLDETTLDRLVRQLRDITEQLESVQPLFDEEARIREEIRDYMTENGIVKSNVDGINLTIGTRKNTQVTDKDQIERTLRYRGVLEDCLILDMPKVRKILGDDALGLHTTEHKYLIVKEPKSD